MVVWGFSLRSTCDGVQESLAAVRRGPWRCLGAEEGLGVIWLLYSDTLRVRLCHLGPSSPGEAFWSLLGGGGGRLQGLMHGPKSPRALGGRGMLCLMSCPRRDPVRGAVGRDTPGE
jgi:hypothetical protein